MAGGEIGILEHAKGSQEVVQRMGAEATREVSGILYTLCDIV